MPEGGYVDPKTDKKVQVRSCCLMKGSIQVRVEVESHEVRYKLDERKHMQTGANAHVSITQGTDSASDSGNYIDVDSKQKVGIVENVKYTIIWQIKDFCKSLKVIMDTTGNITSHEESLPSEGQEVLSTSTVYETENYNQRNPGWLDVRIVAIDLMGDSLILEKRIPAPPSV